MNAKEQKIKISKPIMLSSKDDERKSSLDDENLSETMYSSNSPRNPFKLPPLLDKSILENDKNIKKLKRKLRSVLPLHKKTTESFVEKLTSSNVLKTIPDVPLPSVMLKSVASSIRNDVEFKNAVATGERIRSMQNVSNFIQSNREAFLIQYMIGIKKGEMFKMEETERNQERQLGYAERMLEEDAVKFDNFLKQTDREAVDAVKEAELEAKRKIEKVIKLKKIHVQISAIKSEISKLEDVLLEYEECGKFLFKLSPVSWQNQQLELAERKRRSKTSTKVMFPTQIEKRKQTVSDRRQSKVRKSSVGMFSRKSFSSVQWKRPLVPIEAKRQSEAEALLLSDLESSSSAVTITSRDSGGLSPFISLVSSQYDDEDDDEDILGIYFSHPQQLLDIFQDLEEMNLTMIQRIQETEEALDELRANLLKIKKKMGREMDILKNQIVILEKRAETEHDLAYEFETKSKLFSYGAFDDSAQGLELKELNFLVESVYENTFGPNNVNLSTIQMMTSLENRLEDLLQRVEELPELDVERAVKIRDRQRRIDLRYLKLREQQELQQKKRVRIMEKIMTSPRMTYGRKLVYRSNPPQLLLSSGKIPRHTRDEEEYTYFFT